MAGNQYARTIDFISSMPDVAWQLRRSSLTVENTDGVRRKPAGPPRLDESDRTLSGLLAEDSTRSYAELGARCCSKCAHATRKASSICLSAVTRSTVSKHPQLYRAVDLSRTRPQSGGSLIRRSRNQ